MENTIAASIAQQRKALAEMVAPELAKIAESCSRAWPDRQALNEVLARMVDQLPYCSFLYCMETDGIQISDNVNKNGYYPEHFGRDRSQRPYLKTVYPSVDYWLSDAYISLLSSRPSITAIQLIRSKGQVIGLLGADFDLRNLPLTQKLYDEPGQWRQIKGDPAIRGSVFQQTRAKSVLDEHIDEVIAIMTELFTQRGVFHGKILFSSSRASLWLLDDPYRYRILEVESLIDPDICFAYPLHPYPENALIPADKIGELLDGFKRLRLADETMYLRSGSINIFNGLIGLNFSCDGSHYLAWDEFLNPNHSFWSGKIESTTRPA